MHSQRARTAVVTGAGSGLGRELVLGLVRRGYRTFGTAVSAAEVDEVAALTDGHATLTVCDVTDPSAVTDFAAAVSSQVADQGLSLLISNAATITPGPLEVLPIDAIRREFEVNVFGGLSMINALLPALRRSSSRARIIQIGTRASRFPTPYNGPCAASKAAMNIFADVYRAELHTSNVDVVVAVVGGMRTSGFASVVTQLQTVLESLDESQRDRYASSLTAFARRVRAGHASALSAAEAAQRVIELAEQVPAPIEVSIGIEAEQAVASARTLTGAELHHRRLEMIGLRDQPVKPG